MAPGGKIKKSHEEVGLHLAHMETLAEAMAEEWNWNFLAQYSILKEMLGNMDINIIPALIFFVKVTSRVSTTASRTTGKFIFVHNFQTEPSSSSQKEHYLLVNFLSSHQLWLLDQ